MARRLLPNYGSTSSVLHGATARQRNEASRGLVPLLLSAVALAMVSLSSMVAPRRPVVSVLLGQKQRGFYEAIRNDNVLGDNIIR